ncbi:ComF family protein [Plebeiibacterium marinum]|uniref:Phosphoribosyltransferase family protein n=1 Tax=Plebeiibacterium marinum TaxID=2992111 RepID=A0AAE3MAS2_9BACT|nr:phosphoribosyltransferase family protein [Plebeiobacterium marinum]MCW3804453.1 phosphoribosyltransferase family protein [Plebeiobacterium marinum]
MTFWGRTPIDKATSLLLYTKGDKTKQILHSIKYRNNIALAEEMGKMIAHNLSESNLFSTIDYIIPVPLHPAKLNKRGYNQSEIISNGISKITKIPVETDILFKTLNTSTQTKKNRFERWKNAENIYELRNSSKIKGKKILLIDDVLTTGATLEACATALHLAEISGLSIITLAYAAN